MAVAQIKAATRQRVKYLLWIGLSCLLVTGGWFSRNGLVYGDLLGRYFIIDPATFSGEIAPKALFSAYFSEYFWRMVGQSLVGKFGFMHIDMPDGFYRLWLAVGSISAVGVLSRGMRWKRAAARAEVRADSSVWLLMSCAVVLAIVELVQFNLTISQPQGRLMAHVLPAMAIVLVAGWLESSLLVQRGVSKLWPNFDRFELPASSSTAALSVAGLLLGLNLWALCCVVLPAYATR